MRIEWFFEHSIQFMMFSCSKNCLSATCSLSAAKSCYHVNISRNKIKMFVHELDVRIMCILCILQIPWMERHDDFNGLARKYFILSLYECTRFVPKLITKTIVRGKALRELPLASGKTFWNIDLSFNGEKPGTNSSRSQKSPAIQSSSRSGYCSLLPYDLFIASKGR